MYKGMSRVKVVEGGREREGKKERDRGTDK
jgi:hypothetical protein